MTPLQLGIVVCFALVAAFDVAALIYFWRQDR